MTTHLPAEVHGQRSLAGYSPWGRKESDTTEKLSIETKHLGYVGCTFLRICVLQEQAQSSMIHLPWNKSMSKKICLPRAHVHPL